MSLLAFLAAVTLVLLIACATANLMLARGAARQREIAVRTALGAGRGRLIRQLLTESMFIAILGGVVGAGFGVWGVQLLRFAFPNDVPFYITLAVDPRALVFAAVIIALTGMLFGAIPAFSATRVDVNSSLRDGARGSESAARVNVRGLLVVGEVGMSVVLLIGADAAHSQLPRLHDHDARLDERGILTGRVSLPRKIRRPQSTNRVL